MQTEALVADAAPLARTAVPVAAKRLRVLTFTSLFPSPARTRHGIFVETRLQHLVRDCPVDARVIAPVPWFPFASPRFGAYAQFARTPRSDLRPQGLAVTYPRYLMVPRVGVAWQPDAMALAARGDVARLLRSGWRPDLIDAHYLYPDGVAASLLARRLGVPFVMTARGTDVNVLARQAGSGRRILDAIGRAHAVVTVSASLKRTLQDIGAPGEKIVVLRNGVDAAVFQPEERDAACERLGLDRGSPWLLCVGNLLPEKGQQLAIEVLQHLPQHRLLLVGDGPQRQRLLDTAHRLGVDARVQVHGVMPQADLRWAYSAADALLLTSTREGWPNVVLESMACGTPVVSVDVGGVPEMITRAEAGRVVPSRDPRELAAAVLQLRAQRTARAGVRAHALQFDWATISRGQYDLFLSALPSGAQIPG